ncbi:MAG: excinuclease ABC subunit UvrA, partial [Sphaerochaetaceae bacterium]|nr:excinuclease ABC subunit UvrA [Sphaerochaetaceae bacterium]
MNNKLVIRGAREHNLKNINLDLEKDRLIVISGLSGSGKSSLAFDTIFAEGQRRYVESLSAYARQFLGRLEKPDVDFMEGLSPSIAIEQKSTHKNPRSIVGTITEIYDYFRLLWARVGHPHCPECGLEISEQTVDQIIESIYQYPDQSKLMIMAPVVLGRKGEHKKIFEDAKKSGFVRVRVDNVIHELSETITLDKQSKHTIEVIIDRIILRADSRSRLAEALESASSIANGLVKVILLHDDGKEVETTISEHNRS